MYPVQLIVGNNVAYAAKQGGGTIANWDEVNSLVVGGIALFTDGGTLITAATTDTALREVKSFQIATNTGGGVVTTRNIPRDAFNFTKFPYVAPVKQVNLIGASATPTGSMNYPTIVAGMVAEIVIVDTTLGDYRIGTIERYQVVAKTGDTGAILTAALIAKINANTESIVTATVVGANVGITITAKEFGTTFTLKGAEILANATIWNGSTEGAVRFVPGTGTLANIKAYEAESDLILGRAGVTYAPAQFWWKVPSAVDGSAASTFETWVFQWQTTARVGGNTMNVAVNDVVLAFPVNASFEAALDTIVGLLRNVTYTTAEAPI